MDKRLQKEVVDKLCRELADQGLLIAAGWKSYRMLVVPLDAPAIQIEECRIAFYAGCQHLFGSLAGTSEMFDPGQEPTDGDLKRLAMISSELDQFLADFRRRHPEHFTHEPAPAVNPS